MVTFYVISEYSKDPPTEFGRFKISTGPLYDLARVQFLVTDENRLKAWTKKCRNDVDKYFAGDYEELAKLIQCIKARDYIDSEWCENGSSFIAACDAYTVRRQEEMPGTGRLTMFEYFLKFAISKTGTLVLAVSCHTS